MMNSAVLNSLLINASYLIGSQWFSQGLRSLYAFLIAFWLGPEVFGQYFYGMSWYLLLMPLAVWGTDIVISRQFRREGVDRSELATHTLLIRLLNASGLILLAGGYWAFADSDNAYAPLLFLFMFVLPARALATWADQLFAASGVSHHTFKLTTRLRSLEVLLGVLLLLLDFGVFWLIGLHIFAWWLQALLGIKRLASEGVEVDVHRYFDLPSLWKYFPGGLSFMLAAFAYTAFLQGPVAMFPQFHSDPVLLGTLSLLMQFLILFVSIPAFAGIASLALLSENPDGAFKRQISYIQGLLKVGFVFAFVLGISADLFAPWLFNVVFADRYPLAAPVAQSVFWLAGPLTWLIAAIHTSYSMDLRHQVLMALLLGNAMMLCLAFLTVAEGGVLAAILSMGAGMCVSVLLLGARLFKQLGLAVVENFLLPALVTLVGAAVYFSADSKEITYPAALVVFALLSYRFMLSNEQRQKLLNTLSARN